MDARSRPESLGLSPRDRGHHDDSRVAPALVERRPALRASPDPGAGPAEGPACVGDRVDELQRVRERVAEELRLGDTEARAISSSSAREGHLDPSFQRPVRSASHFEARYGAFRALGTETIAIPPSRRASRCAWKIPSRSAPVKCSLRPKDMATSKPPRTSSGSSRALASTKFGLQLVRLEELAGLAAPSASSRAGSPTRLAWPSPPRWCRLRRRSRSRAGPRSRRSARAPAPRSAAIGSTAPPGRRSPGADRALVPARQMSSQSSGVLGSVTRLRSCRRSRRSGGRRCAPPARAGSRPRPP